MADRLTADEWTYYRAASALVRSAHVMSQRLEEVLKEHDLTFARYELLLLLSWSPQGQMGLTRIGDQLLVHQASITGVVDRLEADGLIRRGRHHSDRRVTMAQITNDGRLLSAAATRTVAERLSLGVDPATADRIFALVQQLRRAARDIS